jgi:hypothetical protein
VAAGWPEAISLCGQKVELSPYATKSGHEFAHTCFGNAAGEWACEPIRLLAKGPDTPRVLDHIAVEAGAPPR